MDRIVVSYTAGDGYTYSCDVVVCVEYESIEALYVHLEEACQQYQAAALADSEASRSWYSKYQDLCAEYKKARKPAAKEEVQARIDTHHLVQPKTTAEHRFTAGNATLDLTHFVDRSHDHGKSVEFSIGMPELQLLEDWWKSKVADG